MRACGFSSVSYASSATSSVQSISVTASRPTDIAELTTTVNPQETGVLGVGDSRTGGNSGNNDDNNNDQAGDDGGSDGGSGAAQGALPGVVACVAGALIGAVMMLQ